MQKSQNPQERILKAAPSLVTCVTMRWEEGKRGRGRGSHAAGTGQENGLEKVSPETSYNAATPANVTGPQAQTHGSVGP